jgi:hypothetical protein
MKSAYFYTYSIEIRYLQIQPGDVFEAMLVRRVINKASHIAGNLLRRERISTQGINVV